jgi:hypothetical protein
LGLDSDLDFNGQKVVASLKALEAAQAANQHIDFSKLDDITKLKTFIESVNLWEERSVPEEVAANSKLNWHKRTDGGYMLMLKSEEIDHFFRGNVKIPVYEQKTVYIKENILGKFEIISVGRTTASPKASACTTVKSKAETDTLQDAFRAVDRAVANAGQDHYLTRGGTDTRPASDRQRQAVAGYYKKQLSSIPFCVCAIRPTTPTCVACKKNNTLTSTQASNLISAHQAKKRG